MVAPAPRSTPTFRSWRSASPACRPCLRAPLSTSSTTGRRTKTWAAGISITTVPLESGPGSHRDPGTRAAASAAPAETARAPPRARWRAAIFDGGGKSHLFSQECNFTDLWDVKEAGYLTEDSKCCCGDWRWGRERTNVCQWLLSVFTFLQSNTPLICVTVFGIIG